MNDSTEILEKSSEAKHYSRKSKVLTAIKWIISWPLIIGIIGFLIAVIAGNTFVNADHINSPQGYQIRAIWAAFVSILVLVCYFFIWRKSRQKNPLNKIRVNILRTYMWLGIIIGVAITAVIPDPQVSTANAGINVQRTDSLIRPDLQSDAVINASLAKVGALDTDGIETKFVAGYDDKILDGQAGEYRVFLDTAGNWSYGVLTVKQGTTGGELDSVVAHEYLHHVWFKALDEPTKTKLTSDLISLYGNDPVIQERVKSYTEKQTLQPTELFSYYCTEASDPYLTPYVMSECEKYIDRSTLKFAR